MNDEFCTTGGDLNLSDPIAETQAIQVENILTSTQIISSPSSVIFTAGNSIFLNPGFVAESETSFRAFIASCTFTPPEPIIIQEEDFTPPKLEQLNAKVFPNPFVDETTIEFYLPESSPIQIMISDLSGRIIHSEENLTVTSGWQRTTFDAGNLPDGLYYLMIQSDKDQVVKKIVVGNNAQQAP